MPVIYLDVLLALNLFIDFLLLTATAGWRHLPHRRGRLVLGAIFGAATACAVLLPVLPWWQQLGLDLLSAAGMCRVAFRWNGWQSFAKTTATLWALSAALGGVCTLLWQVFSPAGFQVVNGVIYYDIPPLTLILLTVVSYGGLTLFERWARPRLLGRHRYRITAEWQGKTYGFEAFYDSGNALTEPFSGRSVIVVASSAVAGWDDGEVRYRIIPYRTAGGDGVYRAFCPQRMTLTVGKRQADISGVWLAVSPQLDQSEVRAVVGTAVVECLTEQGG